MPATASVKLSACFKRWQVEGEMSKDQRREMLMDALPHLGANHLIEISLAPLLLDLA